MKKSELTPQQVFNFVGYRFDLLTSRVLPTQERPHVPFHINVLLNFEKGSKDFYSVLSYYDYEHPNNENKWPLVLNTRLHNDFWKIAYKICFKTILDNSHN